MYVGAIDLTTQQLLDRATTVMVNAFANTLHFLVAALVVLFVGMFVGRTIVKIIDKDAEPFMIWRSRSIHPLPFISSSLVGKLRNSKLQCLLTTSD